MKNKIIIVLMGIILIFGSLNLIINSENERNLAGFAVLNDSSGVLNDSLESESLLNEGVDLNVTEQQVLEAIEEAKDIMWEMEEFNFSILYINDTIIEAERVLEQARNAEILRKKSSSPKKRAEARKVLELIDWEELDYSSVISLINDIKERKERAFIIFDSISATEISLKGFERRGIDISEEFDLLEKAREGFYKDRYDETEGLLDKIRENLKLKNLTFSTLSAIRRGAQTFIEKYWRNYWYIIITLLALISITIFFAQRGIKKKLWGRKILKLKEELKILTDLMKKIQKERFIDRKISKLVYNIRIAKYKDKIEKIKQTLPIIESKLQKISINQGYFRVDNFDKGFGKKS